MNRIDPYSYLRNTSEAIPNRHPKAQIDDLMPSAFGKTSNRQPDGPVEPITVDSTGIIRQNEHFYTRNIGMSCIYASIYGADGQIVGALDLSSARADQTQAFNLVPAAQVAQGARAIEAANFCAGLYLGTDHRGGKR